MTYDVTVNRIGYRSAVIRVSDAEDIRDAKKRALEMAPDVECPSEHDYEYATQEAKPAIEAA